MQPKMIAKICVDTAMTVMLLFLMAYEMIGQTAHEWLGISIFVLFVIHHVLNRKWCSSLLKGRYTLFRIWQTALILGVFLTMLGSMISGIIISRSVLSFLPISGGQSFGRNLHMISAYWGFALMSLHLGLHWNMMMGMAKKTVKKPIPMSTWLLRGIGFLIAAYGAYAFLKRDIGIYMLMQSHFVFFDYKEPLIFFLADYIAVMGLFVLIATVVSFSSGSRFGE
ncbi:DUF4405 domain-containing protein [Anaerovibrio slackiae]|uniref:DUF4405 domain-containing protein n=1 Tax=Anaerovibrio slackiae TaxID=2652309 RepID=UPI003F181AB6